MYRRVIGEWQGASVSALGGDTCF